MANKIKRIKPKGTQKSRAGEAKKATSIEQKAKKASHFFYRCEFQKAIPLLEELSDGGWTPADSLLYWTQVNLDDKTEARTWARKGMDGKDAVSALLWSSGADEKEKAALYDEWSKKAWEQAKSGDFLAMCALAPWAIERADEKSEAELMSMLQKPDVQRCYLVFETLGNLYSAPGPNADLPKAVDFYTTAANMGDNVAAECLAQLYLDPNSEVHNQARGAECTRQAAEAGNLKAMVRMADMYMDGELIPKDMQKALRYYRKAAMCASPDAPETEWLIAGEYFEDRGSDQFDKALICYRQRESTTDPELLEATASGILNATRDVEVQTPEIKRALGYLERAMELGSGEAAATLGLIAMTGLYGVTSDNEKAKEYLEESLRCGYVDAYAKLGVLYEADMGIAPDSLKAREYYEKGAELGSADAICGLGNLYMRGGKDGKVERDQNRAVEYYKKAADLGDLQAMYRLADYYLYVPDKTKRDPEKGMEYLERAVEGEDSDAQVAMGRLYREGTYVDPDPEKAAMYFEEAASQDDPVGLYYLGLSYRDGTGVEKDEDKAMEYLQESANMRFVPAWTAIGYLLSSPKADLQDRGRALKCFKKGADGGDKYAYQGLGEAYLDWPEIHDPVKGVAYLEQGAELGDSECYVMLADRYADGDGVEQDLKKAMEWYEKGAEAGVDDCIVTLVTECAYGDKMEKDEKKGVKYLKKAAKLGDKWAIEILEDIEKNKDLGRRRSLKTAVKKHEQAQLSGIRDSMAPLISMFEEFLQGEGVDNGQASPRQNIAKEIIQERERARQSRLAKYEEAAENGDADGWINLAETYQRGTDNEKDWEKALECYERAASCGDPEAWMLVGDAYYEGDGPTQDKEKAIEYYNKGLEAGFVGV